MRIFTDYWRKESGVLGLGVILLFVLTGCPAADVEGSDSPDQINQQEETNQQNGTSSNGDSNQQDGDGSNQDDGSDQNGDSNPDDGSNQDDGSDQNGDSNQGDGTNQDDGSDQNDAPEVELTADGQAKMSIVVGTDADSAIDTAAGELADYLDQMSGASFDVENGDGTSGIVVGTLEDFDNLPMDGVSFGDDPFEKEDYVLRSTDDGLYLLGASPLAVRFAVWDVLYRFGHRQFFPTDTWEVVPEHDELTMAVDVREEPDYYNRQAPRGAMRMSDRPWAEDIWEEWQLKNRTTPTFTLETGHVYDGVIDENQDAFDANPEYWGLVDGERTSDAQPNVAHDDVQQMFIDHALEKFEEEPSRDSVAMDPRDGNEWSESDESTAIGGPSEQALHMANLVAEEVVAEHGDDKYVGMYGYSHHSPPPEIDAHSNVIVSLATAYIQGGYSFEEMLEGWSEHTDMIGVREYYGIWTWNNSLPGLSTNAANTEYLRESIPKFHEEGARFMNAESNDTWGGYGLGFYLASRMLWDVDEADRMDELIDDFLEKAFGPANDPMGEFYALIDGSATDPYAPERPQPLNDDMVGRMYHHLEEARNLAGDDQEIIDRIDDLILYTRYVELFRKFDASEGSARQDAFEQLVTFAWRIRETMMTESVELLASIDREVDDDDNLSWGGPEPDTEPPAHLRDNEDQPFGDDEIETILQNGIANNELLDFDLEPWEDSGTLEPAGFAPDEREGMTDYPNRGDVEAVLWTDDGTLPELTMSAGHIYDNQGPVEWTLKTDGTVVDTGEVPPDQQDYSFQLSGAESGTYRLSIQSTSQGFKWDYDPRGAKLTLLAGGEHQLEGNWYDRLYFYVPEGTEKFHIAGSIREDRHDFVDGDGNVVSSGDVEIVQGYTVVSVPEGRDGDVWSVEIVSLKPDIRFLDIPGYAAFSPDELLLPEKVMDEL